MAKKKTTKKKSPKKTAHKAQTLEDIEKKLWAAADKLRNNVDAAEYKHVVLGLIFLKYVSDSFDEFRGELKERLLDPKDDFFLEGASDEDIHAELEDVDYYKAANIFWVPIQARWNGDPEAGYKGIQDQAKDSKIGKIIDDAMVAIEKDNPKKLKNILPKDFARRQQYVRLGELVDLIGTIGFNNPDYKAKDILGHVYEYFLGKFAAAEGKGGGQFYTPKSVVNLIVECLEPYEGRVYDPAMGSGGFFATSEKFIESHFDKDHVSEAKRKISLYGQESNPTTWRLSAMNMAIRGLDFNFGKEPGDTFSNNQHPDLKADFIMANPPFNISDWWSAGLENDRRWKYGTPPKGNANFAWVQHMIYHLAPKGHAGIVLSNGSMSSNTNNEGEIRKALVEADLVDCMIALPGQLFFNTQIPACIWILAKTKDGSDGKRKREKEVLFIDARNTGEMINRTQKAFSEEDVSMLAGIYHNWRNKGGTYEDQLGLSKSSSYEEIKGHDFILTPGRYVGTADLELSDVSFDEKVLLLTSELESLFSKSLKLEIEIKNNLKGLGYGS